MSHLVAPVSFRAGKTYPWAHNVLLASKTTLLGGDLTLAKGIERVARSLMRRRRIYVVHGNISGMHSGQLQYRLLYVPRVKIKPREQAKGIFLRKSLYKPLDLTSQGSRLKQYADLRKDKIARLRRRPSPKKLNRWLTRRMFRGTERMLLLRRPLSENKKLGIGFFPRCFALEELVPAPAPGVLTTIGSVVKPSLHKVIKHYYRSIDRRQKWKFEKIALRRFNSRKFSALVGNIIQRPLTMHCRNLFSYLVQKQKLNFKSHQNHFWNFRYRRYRFQYGNYYDILNSFLFMGLLDHTEAFFLSILKITLPLILKIRKFFKFLATVIKYLPEIDNKFSVFKLYIAGKLAGGTKRTKFHSIGYGVLPVQSLTTHAANTFLAYTHIYGEFGLKLVMCKHNNYSSAVLQF